MFQKSKITTILFAAICSLSLLFISCKKDESNPVNPGGGNALQASSIFGVFPVPNVGNYIGGVFGVVDIPYTVLGLTVNVKMAFGGFYSGSSGTPALIHGGDVQINSDLMDTVHTGTNIIYLKPKTISVSGQPNVLFDDATVATFTMAGRVNGVPAFNTQITPPIPSAITTPVTGATLSHTSDVVVSWDNNTATDSVMVIATDANGHSVVKPNVLASAGSVTLTTAELADFSGNGLVYVIKFRYQLSTVSSKIYATIGESVSFVYVTWN